MCDVCVCACVWQLLSPYGGITGAGDDDVLIVLKTQH